jgi:hypothetical protein
VRKRRSEIDPVAQLANQLGAFGRHLRPPSCFGSRTTRNLGFDFQELACSQAAQAAQLIRA